MSDVARVPSGLPLVDDYLAGGFDTVTGMSSGFAAAVCCGLLDIQSRHGVKGHVAEIGAFEGRFLIALAKALGEGERALGMDIFAWPDAGVRARCEANCARFGVTAPTLVTWQVDSARTTSAAVLEKLGEGRVRLFHIDGDHARISLMNDLELATATLADGGVLVLDDMLHPGYPTLMIAVQDYLARHPEMVVLCVIDRETIVAATKFVLCHRDWFKRYEADLMARFKDNVWPMGADFEPHWCLVLSLDTRLAAV